MKEEIKLKYKPINKKPKYKQVTVLHEYIVTIEDKITVPADATLDIISKPIYLEEGDALQLLASAASDLEAVCSYEEIS